MTYKKLFSLTFFAVVLVGAAYFSSTKRSVKTPTQVGKLVLPSFDLSEVARVEISMLDGKKFVLASSDKGWVIPSLFGYPADIVKIREHLLKLKDLKVGHVTGGKPLAAPTLVDLQNAAGKSLTTLRLGEKHIRQPTGEMAQFGGGSFPDGRYVSSAGSDKVFLVKESLEAFDGDPKNWVDTQIATVPSSDIIAIQMALVESKVNLQKKDGAWTIDGLNAKEEVDISKIYSVESALGELNMVTVIDPALSVEQLGITTGAVFTVSLKNGESYTAKIGNTVKPSADRAVKISASFMPVGTNKTEHAEIAKKIAAFNTKVGQWTYVITASSADVMTKTRADLVKPKEEPKKEEAAKEEQK